MGAKSDIGWVASRQNDAATGAVVVKQGATQNFWMGCNYKSEGCFHCYAERTMKMMGREFKKVVRTADSTFYQPLKWKEPRKIFTCSLSDFFHNRADEWRADAWDVIRKTPQHTWMILTKRPELMAERLPSDWGHGWKHVWLGVSAENQETADERLPILLDTPSMTKFVSCEPMTGGVSLKKYLTMLAYCSHPCDEFIRMGSDAGGCNCTNNRPARYRAIDWVITGGESGAKHEIRTADFDWFRALRDECVADGVKFFHKQHGGHFKVDGIWGGRVLDGRTWDESPDDDGWRAGAACDEPIPQRPVSLVSPLK